MTPEWSLVITGDIYYGESRASISQLNSVTGCDHRTAIQPPEGERGSRGETSQGDRAAELHQLCAVDRH